VIRVSLQSSRHAPRDGYEQCLIAVRTPPCCDLREMFERTNRDQHGIDWIAVSIPVDA